MQGLVHVPHVGVGKKRFSALLIDTKSLVLISAVLCSRVRKTVTC